jgi:hypothetical protein
MMPTRLNRVYALRTCNTDLSSRGNFVWPKRGRAEAPDWRNDNNCGGGLHGLLNGKGTSSLLSWTVYAKWLVVDITEAYQESLVIDLGGQVKFPYGDVVHVGNCRSATDYLKANGVTGPIVGETVERGICGKAITGGGGKAITGAYGRAIAGSCGIAIAGRYGTAIAGRYGRAIAGACGTAIAGRYGIAIAGARGKAKAGHRGVLMITCFLQKDNSKIEIVGKVGHKGILPNVFYKVNEHNNELEIA